MSGKCPKCGADFDKVITEPDSASRYWDCFSYERTFHDTTEFFNQSLRCENRCLKQQLTARESELAEAQQRLNEVANAQRNACTTECIDGVWWALGVGIVAGPQATEQDVLLEVAENWWRVAAAAQRRVAELEGLLNAP